MKRGFFIRFGPLKFAYCDRGKEPEMNLKVLFDKFPVLESNYLTLKPVEPADEAELFAIYNNERVFAYCGIFPKHSRATVVKMIPHFQRDYRQHSRVKWGIYSKAHGGRLVGIIEAMDFSQKAERVTIGYYLAEEYWGMGLTTEAVRVLTHFLFSAVAANRIQAEVMPGNLASEQVLLKNGYRLEGLLRQFEYWPGKGIVDLQMFAILRADYPPYLLADQ
jgi:ribosomal-protein-alanine N-acetyltransferase